MLGREVILWGARGESLKVSARVCWIWNLTAGAASAGARETEGEESVVRTTLEAVIIETHVVDQSSQRTGIEWEFFLLRHRPLPPYMAAL